MNLFDYTQRGIEDQANAYAKMSDKEATRAMLYKAGAGIAGGVKGMLGVEDPDMKKASEIKLMTQGLDLTTAKGLKELAIKLGEKGYNQEGAMAAQRARELEKSELDLKKTQAEVGKIDAQAEQAKTIKKSNVEATRLREIVTSAETMLEQGQTLDAPTMTQVRYALAILTKPRPVMDSQTGAIIMTPGLSKEELSPKLAAMLSTPQPQETENAPKWTGTTNNPESTIAGINSIPDPVERQAAMKAFQQTQGGAPSTPKPLTATVIETPKSLEAKKKEAQAVESALDKNQEASDAIDRAFSKVNKNSTGLIGQAFGGIKVTQAGRLRNEINTIKAKLTIDTINEMKNQSKTGATGFGALAVKELEIVQNARESLDPDLPAEDVKEILTRLRTSFAKAREYLKKHQEELAGKTSTSGGNSSIIDKYMEKYKKPDGTYWYSKQEVEKFLKDNGTIK